MKNFIICFLALSSLSFAEITALEQNQNNDITIAAKQEETKTLKNIDYPSAKQQANTKGESNICPSQEPICKPDPCCCANPCCWNSYVSIAFKGSYFWTHGDLMQLLGGGFSPLIETTFTLYRWLNLFIEAGYYHRDVHIRSIIICADSKITAVPVSLGLNFTWRLTSCIDLYFKVGPNWVYTKMLIENPDFKLVSKMNTFGGTFGSGIKFYVTKSVFLEVFANYLYGKKNIHDIQAGGGLGFRF